MIVMQAGWEAVNLFALPVVAAMIVTIGWLTLREGRQVAA